MGMAAILVMWPGTFEQTFVSPSHRSSIWNLTLIGPVVSEEKMLSVDDVRQRTTEAYLSYKLTKWAFGSGELKMTCAPSEDSDQPGHPPSLIRVFAVRMKKAWVPGWSESSLGTQPFCWFCHEAAQMSYVTRKSVFGVCNPIRLKPACSVTEASKSLGISDIAYYLNSVLSQCARGKSSLAWKPEVHPKFF